jgi:Ni/Fe-hydrogenase b-type cytochrome subunit
VDQPKDERLNRDAKEPSVARAPGEQIPCVESKPSVPGPETEKRAAGEATETSPPYIGGELSVGGDALLVVPESEVDAIPTAIAAPSQEIIEKKDAQIRAAYEHPWVVRFSHWLNAVSLFIMIATGLRIFRAFPSFGPKVPQNNLVNIPAALTLGGWLGGALRWHFTFMWIFVATGVLYIGYQLLSGYYKTVLFVPRDIPGVWPMARHYFLFGPKPAVTGPYNPLQKLAYTSTVLFGVASVLTGIVLYKPIQFSWLAWIMGGFHLARIWHFAAMCGFLSFIPGHLIMVVLHGWNNFFSMLSGWKKDPEYLVD